jgi:hypothetical protein
VADDYGYLIPIEVEDDVPPEGYVYSFAWYLYYAEALFL